MSYRLILLMLALGVAMNYLGVVSAYYAIPVLAGNFVLFLFIRRAPLWLSLVSLPLLLFPVGLNLSLWMLTFSQWCVEAAYSKQTIKPTPRLLLHIICITIVAIYLHGGVTLLGGFQALTLSGLLILHLILAQAFACLYINHTLSSHIRLETQLFSRVFVYTGIPLLILSLFAMQAFIRLDHVSYPYTLNTVSPWTPTSSSENSVAMDVAMDTHLQSVAMDTHLQRHSENRKPTNSMSNKQVTRDSLVSMTIVLALVLFLLGLRFFCRKVFIEYGRSLNNIIRQMDSFTPRVGKVDFVRDVNEFNSLEFDKLKKSFYRLQSRIIQAHADLDKALKEKHQLNEQLEKRVEQRTQALLEQKERADHLAHIKTRFLANMSHELRTPLTIMLGQLALIDGPLNSEQHAALESIQQQGDILLQLVNDVLDTIRIDEGKLKIEAQQIEIVRFVESISQTFQLEADKKALTLELEVCFPIPQYIQADPLRLRQILYNLLSNALKYTQQGFIRIVLSVESHEFCLAVIDTGIGINAMRQQAIFDAFEQADSSTARRFGGSGLGLFISYHLAKLLGGKLTCESEENAGTCMTLTFPLNSDAIMLEAFPNCATSGINNYDSENEFDLISGRVLLVDDVVEIQILLERILTRMGLEVVSTNNGFDAIELVQLHYFDVLLIDKNMPQIDGLQTTRKIRALIPNLPVVMITADVLSEERELCLEAGATSILSKPINIKALRDCLLQLGLKNKQEHALSPQSDEDGDLSNEFLRTLPQYAEKLKQAFEGQDLHTLRQESHALKGTAACFNFVQISDAAKALEKMAKNHQYERKQLEQLLSIINQFSVEE